MNQAILNSIEEASSVIGKTWPLYTFVASNPLAGYEKASFLEAVSLAQKYFSANAFPAANLYRQALENEYIDSSVLVALLKENGFSQTPASCLEIMEKKNLSFEVKTDKKLNQIMVKWLAAFMDEGLAEWEMPFKTEGFYQAWRLLAPYDSEIGTISLKDIPKTSSEALESLLNDYDKKEYVAIFTQHLTALPGWSGYINHRIQSNSQWQQEFPIDVMDYLAVRLWIAKKIKAPFYTLQTENNSDELVSKMQYIWLQAWEKSWQNQLVNTLEKIPRESQSLDSTTTPDAQLVFCIDTRSEVIRRHVESKGNYETFGYAGFFGIAMDYQNFNDGIIRKSCPPIVTSAYTVSESAQPEKNKVLKIYQKKNKGIKFYNYFLKRMKNMLPSAFGYVEGSGLFYGFSLVKRTLLPSLFYAKKELSNGEMESICQPNIHKVKQKHNEYLEISLEEKVAIVKSAFDLMGWKQFAPLVLFVGHGSHSSNNPFGSSLDCGACAASPGRHNARMLAKLANSIEVRNALSEKYNIIVPDTTMFLGAEHNTTTDAIVVFDAQAPDAFHQLIKDLKTNLTKAQSTCVQEKFSLKDGLSLAKQKANDWSETRPEWGLAKNAGFIVGPRSLTQHANLGGRCFLHSYDWELDATGKALEGIMQGPMVVTQWINNHYYFSTVDNKMYGGGSKVTANITGKFGVVEGNGGDLKMGLPLQSLYESDEVMYHQPLRLTVVIQAPLDRVTEIVARNNNLKTLLDNEWIYLMVMEPKQNNRLFQYKKELDWKLVSNNKNKETVRQGTVKEPILME